MFPSQKNKLQRLENHSLKLRIRQFIAFLLGTRFFKAILLTFALYVSTYFLFNHTDDFHHFVFNYKVHGIILCTILSVLAGGIINQFYDLEKDQIIKPFRTKIQSFVKQKYFLGFYILLSFLSLGISFFISVRVFLFFIVYQFFMWFYSHKLSKIAFLNNITFVGLTLYPFFGMMIFYQTFSGKVFLMALFLFFVLLCIDVLKDQLTQKADRIFGYNTIATLYSQPFSHQIILLLLSTTLLVSILLVLFLNALGLMWYYFFISIFILLTGIIIHFLKIKNWIVFNINLLQIWIFLGILFMLFSGLYHKF